LKSYRSAEALRHPKARAGFENQLSVASGSGNFKNKIKNKIKIKNKSNSRGRGRPRHMGRSQLTSVLLRYCGQQ
jgi:hypothetical protein